MQVLFHIICRASEASVENFEKLIIRHSEVIPLENNIAKKGDNLSRLVTKPTKWHVRPAKTQISLGIHLN